MFRSKVLPPCWGQSKQVTSNNQAASRFEFEGAGRRGFLHETPLDVYQTTRRHISLFIRHTCDCKCDKLLTNLSAFNTPSRWEAAWHWKSAQNWTQTYHEHSHQHNVHNTTAQNQQLMVRNLNNFGVQDTSDPNKFRIYKKQKKEQ